MGNSAPIAYGRYTVALYPCSISKCARRIPLVFCLRPLSSGSQYREKYYGRVKKKAPAYFSRIESGSEISSCVILEGLVSKILLSGRISGALVTIGGLLFGFVIVNCCILVGLLATVADFVRCGRGLETFCHLSMVIFF